MRIIAMAVCFERNELFAENRSCSMVFILSKRALIGEDFMVLRLASFDRKKKYL
jgi:hypothetical protein